MDRRCDFQWLFCLLIALGSPPAFAVLVERFEGRVVERLRLGDVAHADRNMVEHWIFLMNQPAMGPQVRAHIYVCRISFAWGKLLCLRR